MRRRIRYKPDYPGKNWFFSCLTLAMPSDPEVEGLPGYPMAASATTPTLRNLSDGDDEYPWLRTNP